MSVFTIGAPTTIPTGSATVELFNSITAFGGPGRMTNNGMQRISVGIDHDESLTLKASHSPDGGVNWYPIYSAVKAGPVTGPVNFLVSPYIDVKIEVENGGTDQTTWAPLLRGYETMESGL